MSKTEMVKRSAQEQAAPAAQKARSTAESQQQLIKKIEEMAVGMSNLTEDQRLTCRKLLQAIESSTLKSDETIRKATTETGDLLTKVSATVTRADTLLTATAATASDATKRLSAAVARAERQANRKPWALIAMSAAFGLMTGILLLTVFMIWQPELIQRLWQVAQTIRQ